MKNTASNSSFNWGAEDLVSNAYRAFKNGSIDSDRYESIRSMSEVDKLSYVEDLVESFEEYLIEEINNFLYSAIVDDKNNSLK